MVGYARHGDHGGTNAPTTGEETGRATTATGSATGSRSGRRGPAGGGRLLSRAALLVLVMGLLVGAASPADAARRHRQPRPGQGTELNCQRPTAIRQGGRVVVSARTVRALCRLFDGGTGSRAAAAGQPDLAAEGGVGAAVGAQAFGDCVINYYNAYGDWVQGGDGSWWCLRDWYDAAGSYYASTVASYHSPLTIDFYAYYDASGNLVEYANVVQA